VVRENQVIHVEDLPVRGLSRGRLAKSVQDAAWGQFRRLLEEKAARRGRTVVAVDRYAPTSQVCSACGHRDGAKALSVRTWTCPDCGSTFDRDTNAACNILARGRRERLNACGADVGPPPAAVGLEAGTHRPVAA
jgi:putative transposase